MSTIAVVGATGRVGRRLVSELAARGSEVLAVGRDEAQLTGLEVHATTRCADLTAPETLARALAGAVRIVSCAHAGFAPALIEALPAGCERLVLMGSTRAFTSRADPQAEAVRAGVAAFSASKVPGLVLHPSMIYGPPDDNNVSRILSLVKRFPVVPLPDGGHGLLQPVFIDDVVAALAAAVLEADLDDSQPVVVAGPEPVSYREVFEACAAAQGRRIRIVPVPAGVLAGGARLAARLGLEPPVDADELMRSREHRVFDVGPLRRRLGVSPRSFADGLRLKFERGWL